MTTAAAEIVGKLAAHAHAPDPEVVTPSAVRLIELDASLDHLELGVAANGAPYRSLVLIVRNSGRPVGTVLLRDAGAIVEADCIRTAIRTQLGDLTPTPSPDDAAKRRSTPAISVVVPSCGGPALERCVNSILHAGRGMDVDVIVVDNRPETSDVADRVACHFSGTDDRVRYIAEPRRGSSWARNAGLTAAGGELVAFADDDVIVDPSWLVAAGAAFAAHGDAGCVTGLILPLRLDTPAQMLVEQLAGFGKGFETRRFALPESLACDPLFPYTPGHMGSGASMMFRKELALRLGGFDTKLGPGTPAHGGEELDLFVRVVKAGSAVVYEPTAFVWHDHPDDEARLRRQAYRYGVGLTAMLSKQLLAGPERRHMLRRLPAAVRYITDPASRKNVHKPRAYPWRLTALERLGMVTGPCAYFVSLTQAATVGPHDG